MASLSRAKVREVFSEAVERGGADREAYLAAACGTDSSLRREVDRLLDALETRGGVLDDSFVGELLEPKQAQTLQPGDLVAQRFRIVRLLGRGGMGEVYEAGDEEFGGVVALKTLRSDFLMRSDLRARFRREIQLSRKATHANVCRIFDVGRHVVDGREITFLTMDLLKGETLAERLSRGRLDIAEAAPILRQILNGLGALHEAGVIHRDLKPGNVILTPAPGGPRAVITDFGLAHAVVSEAGSDNMTQAGEILGTSNYMAPEQITGRRIGPQTDVYALGIVMYEMLCGRRPFEADSFGELAALKLTTAPPPPEKFVHLGERWSQLILRCLERDPKDRPASVQEILGRFAELESGAHVVTGDRSGEGPLPRKNVRTWAGKPVYWTATVAVAALGAAILSMPPVRSPLMRSLCQAAPGSALWCQLPDDKDVAVLPFEIRGATEADKAVAAGLARHVREGFGWLAPDPAHFCVHLREDRQVDGVRLVLNGSVEAVADQVVMRYTLSQSKPDAGKNQALVLREGRVAVPRTALETFHTSAMQELAKAFQVQYPSAKWQVWAGAGPRGGEAFAAYLAGIGQLERGRYEEAAESFRAATDPARDFMFAPAQVALGDAYRLLGNRTGENSWWLRARQAYQRAVPLDRDSGFAGAERRLGELEASAGDVNTALKHLASALQKSPSDHLLRKLVSSTYEKAGRLDEAERTLREGAELTPQCWLAHNALASLYSRHARYREAETSFLQVLRLAPDNSSGYHNLAFDYVKVGRLDEAIELCARAIELQPRGLWYSTLGRAYLYRGCTSDALVNLRKAVELDPGYYPLWAALSEGTHAAGSADANSIFERAATQCERALQQDPTDAYARAQLALSLARGGNHAEGERQARLAVVQAPRNHNVAVKAAEAFEQVGRRNEALAVLGRALKEGLSIHEMRSVFGLRRLRQTPAYAAMLGSLGLDPGSDPGGLVPPSSVRACPDWQMPGKGMPPGGNRGAAPSTRAWVLPSYEFQNSHGQPRP